MNFIIGTSLGYIHAITLQGVDGVTKQPIYGIVECYDFKSAKRFPTAEAAAEEANKSWLLQKEGYAVIEVKEIRGREA